MANQIEARFSFNVSEINETKRDLLAGIAKRADWEAQHNAPESMFNTLRQFAGNVERADSYTISGARGMGLTGNFFTSQIVRDACRNVYSLRKILVLCRVIQGSAFLHGKESGDDGTTFATIIGIAEGKRKQSLTNRVDEICSAMGMGRVPGNYTSGLTQSGSSVAALQALDVLEATHGARVPQDKVMWEALVKAAKVALKKHAPTATPFKGDEKK